MSYSHVCDPCRQALKLPATESELNNFKRKTGGFSASGTASPGPNLEVFRRDETGKPSLVGYRRGDHIAATPSRCVCHCVSNDHDPKACTGEDDYVIGGRPGSGLVDKLAHEFGIEPTPEMVASLHEQMVVLVRVMIAWMEGDTDTERLAVEKELEKVRYEDQLIRLRNLIAQRMPEQAKEAPYKDLKPNLKKLAAFRNQMVSHTWPTGGDWLHRVRRVDGKWETFTLTADEVAKHIDLAVNLQSQLGFLPVYISVPANDDPDAVQRLTDTIEGKSES